MVGYNFHSLIGIAGPLEVVGGALLIFGLFTRTTAFILSGEMAVAYFTRWAPRGFWPISNGGEESALFCFVFFWFVFAGPGLWSFDELLHKIRNQKKSTALVTEAPQEALSSWEGPIRSLLRVVLAFTFSLHGYRLPIRRIPNSGRPKRCSSNAIGRLASYLRCAGDRGRNAIVHRSIYSPDSPNSVL